MTFVQKLFKKILPASWSGPMEAESREWMMRCRECGEETSIWELGGIRWKASGNPARGMRCFKCGKLAMHDTYRKTEENL